MVARRLVTEKGSRNRTGKRTVEKIASVDLTARPCPEGKWQLHSNLTDMDRRAVYALAYVLRRARARARTGRLRRPPPYTDLYTLRNGSVCTTALLLYASINRIMYCTSPQ